MSKPNDPPYRVPTEALHNLAETYFDAQLASLSLTKKDIDNQSLQELQLSLQRINDAIDHPEQFGMAKIQITPLLGPILVQSEEEAHYTIGALTILLERKRLVLDRLTLLRQDQQISTLRDLITMWTMMRSNNNWSSSLIILKTPLTRIERNA